MVVKVRYLSSEAYNWDVKVFNEYDEPLLEFQRNTFFQQMQLTDSEIEDLIKQYMELKKKIK